jgi:hypothetical protein
MMDGDWEIIQGFNQMRSNNRDRQVLFLTRTLSIIVSVNYRSCISYFCVMSISSVSIYTLHMRINCQNQRNVLGRKHSRRALVAMHCITLAHGYIDPVARRPIGRKGARRVGVLHLSHASCRNPEINNCDLFQI